MMVTFISQCQKNALKKTRRVLDAFAERIGDNTWQTVITEDGLAVVKKMLRKTASKNTAVACHWIRSRSRSEFIWAVGNRDMFNEQGRVAVNYTGAEIIMDKLTVKTETIYANTKQQVLTEHLFAVGYVAYRLIKRLLNDDKLAKAVFVAGCLHDLGKVDPHFQTWLADELKKKKLPEIPEEGQHIETGKFSFEDHPRHNEISLLLYYLLDDETYKTINKAHKNLIKHALYWHHAKPIRKVEFKNFETIYKKLRSNLADRAFPDLVYLARQIIKDVNVLSSNYCDEALNIEGIRSKVDDEKLHDLGQVNLPEYKKYSPDEYLGDYLENISTNTHHNLARAAVISSDRIVSALSKEQLTQYLNERSLDELISMQLNIQSDLTQQIQACLRAFENASDANRERNQHQSLAAQKLAKVSENGHNVKVLQGPAGCGKTKIALEWAALSQAKQILWICPRVLVCQGLLDDLSSQAYLFNSKIEIYTGEFKYQLQAGKQQETAEDAVFSGDIVITTIDQVVNGITTHRTIESFITYMNVHVVFDEYHEYINMPAFNLLFAELVESKKKQQQHAHALLVSATPNYYFVEKFLGINPSDIVSVPSFNRSSYAIQFQAFDESKWDESNPFYQPQPARTFVISNTVLAAQRSFIRHQQNEKAILLHSKFKKSDKQNLFDKTLANFGRNGVQEYKVLRSAMIVQAALNISCMRMVTEFTHAENWLQRLGRLDRFGENPVANEYLIAIPESLVAGKQQGSCARFLNSLNTLQSAKKWYEFLQSKLDDKPITIPAIYQFYSEFYRDASCVAAVEQDFIKALKGSAKVIEDKLIDPVTLPRKPSATKVKIKKSSLRGDNRFVQMAVCKMIDLNQISFPDLYAYDEGSDAGELTCPVEEICGYSNSEQNLLAFMVKKHHNIKGGKKPHKDYLLLNEARSPDTPIYLSYVPEDLKKVEAQPHAFAIYYAEGIHQPIGAISINKLQGE